MNEFSLIQYLMQVAPALGISVWALYLVWGRYTKVQDDTRELQAENTKYHRENDKENLGLMIEFKQLLTTLLSNSELTKDTLTKEIRDQAQDLKTHIDSIIARKNV
jgi:hypothetical protein